MTGRGPGTPLFRVCIEDDRCPNHIGETGIHEATERNV
jgi:hypothetical protein